MKYFLISLCIVLFTGCTTKTAAPKEYRLVPNVQVKDSDIMACTHSLKVQKLFTPASFMTQKMYYGIGEYQQLPYTQAEWVDAPGRMIGDLYVGFLEGEKIFQSVHSYRSQAKTDLLLEIALEDFMQYYDAEYKTSHAKAKITLTLLDAVQKKGMASKTFMMTQEVPSLDASGGVTALNKLLNVFMQESSIWLREVCQ